MTRPRRSHCKRGHRMTEQNSRWRVKGDYVLRGCRMCLSVTEKVKYRAGVLGVDNKLTVGK